ncbi:hypothetical protein [Dysgonomonas termitidis]|uniref:Uncharacterized protein n=1 Tax=Dysgonomonas termitidis TaxID=1516126 RepID=A0ABV9KZX0_9BACT
MDEKLAKIIDANIDNIPDWIETINTYNSRFEKEELSEDNRVDLTYKIADVLSEISDLHFKYGNFKDKFDKTKMHLNVYGLNLIIKSEKLDCTFYWGIDSYEGLYIDTYMKEANNLRYMTDDFYKDLMSLSDLGDFTIGENLGSSKEMEKKYNGLFNNQKSKIFNLLREYIIGIVENEKYIDLGSFRIKWNYETDFNELVQNSCLAFKILYKMNYSLWKISDLHRKKK